MSITDSFTRDQYSASAGQTTFNYKFKIFHETELLVYQTPDGQEPDETNDKLNLNANYTVTGVGNKSGGTIVLKKAASKDDVITIMGDSPYERSFDYKSGGDITASQLNNDFDKLTVLTQQNNTNTEKLRPRYERPDILNDFDLELPKLEANEIWKMNSDGNKIQALNVKDNDLDLKIFEAELASEVQGSDGARLVGYYDSTDASGKTLKVKLDELSTASTLPVDDTQSIVKDPSVNSKQMRIDVGAVSSSTTRVLHMPDKDVFLGNLSGAFATGMIIPSMSGSAPTGWIVLQNGTIGNALSTASIRKNADTEDLFKVIWDNISNAHAPVEPGGRGTSAADDFANNKTIALPTNNAMIIGNAFGHTSSRGETDGNRTHTLSLNEMPDHHHEVAYATSPEKGSGNNENRWLSEPNNANLSVSTTGVDDHSGSTSDFSIQQPTLWLNWFVKL